MDDDRPKCKTHKEPCTHLCECKKMLICGSCMGAHSGFEHNKVSLEELGKTYSGFINKQLLSLDDRLGRYSTTLAGKINFVTTEYINGMHAMIDEFREVIAKRYDMIRDTFAPFQKIDEKAMEMKEIADEFAETEGVPPDIMKKIELCEKNALDIDSAFAVVGEINEKYDYFEEDKIDTNLIDELAEFRDYVEDLFLTFKFPMSPEDTEFHKRKGGLKNHRGKAGVQPGAGGMMIDPDAPKGKSALVLENEKYVKGDEDDLQVDIEEDFDVVEGRTYKGHSSWVKDIIRLGGHQFAT